MPSGQTHDKIALIILIPTFWVCYSVLNLGMVESLLITFSSTLTQMMFSPDLDTKSCQYKRWGLFRWVWLPYMFLIKHRSRFSHGLIFGPITRISYFLGVLVLLFWGINYLSINYLNFNLISYTSPYIESINLSEQNINTLITIALLMFIGLFVGTFCHTIADKIQSFFKNMI